MEMILSIITVILGGTNIMQFVLWRQEKKKANAEASSAETESERKKYELSKDKADWLIESLSKVQKEYMELQEQVRDQSAKYTNEILGKCAIIADLKSQVVYLKGLRCYKSDCSLRISKHEKDNNHIKENNDEGK